MLAKKDQIHADIVRVGASNNSLPVSLSSTRAVPPSPPGHCLPRSPSCSAKQHKAETRAMDTMRQTHFIVYDRTESISHQGREAAEEHVDESEHAQ
eukprot:6199377-Pleurochrysis_carterae.AAC.1